MVIRRPVAFKRGDSGPFIADAQEMLAKLGFDPGGPEGVFVSRTEDAVRAFQREYGLEVTGILDCATLKLLYEEVDPQGYPAVLMEGTGAAEEPPDEFPPGESSPGGFHPGRPPAGGSLPGGFPTGTPAAPGPAPEPDTGGEAVARPVRGPSPVLGAARAPFPAPAPAPALSRTPTATPAPAPVPGPVPRPVPEPAPGSEPELGLGAGAGAGPGSGAEREPGPVPELRRGEATRSVARADGETASVASAAPGAPARSIVISVGERALGLYEGDRLVRRYPVAIGKPSTPTPVGIHRILEKIMYPGGGLGTRWMAFTYQMHGIHGTNRPELIGQAVSNGCVRMYNEDVEELYDLVDVGTPVTVIAGPVGSWPSMGKAGSEGAPQPVGVGMGSGTGGQQGGPHSSRPGSGSGPGFGSDLESGSGTGPGSGPGSGPATGGGTGGATGAASPGAGPGGGAGGGPWGSSGGPLSGPGGGPAGPAGGSGGGLWSPGSPRPKDAPGGGSRTYIVQPGDSLWSIAQRFGTTVDAIVATNNIANPDLIYPGDVLKIP